MFNFQMTRPSGFGAVAPSTFGQPQQQQQQQFMQLQQPHAPQVPVVNEQAAFYQSLFGCCKFGDERDAILANLNFIQACLGAGAGIYSQTNPPVPYNKTNPIYRFKTVMYSHMFKESNEDGLVAIHVKKARLKLTDGSEKDSVGFLVGCLQNMLANPHISLDVVGIKSQTDDLTMVVIAANDRSTLRRILATKLASAFENPQYKPQLDNLGVVSLYAKVKPSPEQLKAYLENVPAGLDPRVWKKAQEDNPNPENMIPVPLVGSEALLDRIHAQQRENQQQFKLLEIMNDEITNLHKRHLYISAELEQIKFRTSRLSKRITLGIMLQLVVFKRQGTPLQPEEDNFKQKMQQLAQQLNSPVNVWSRLNKLKADVRLQKAGLGKPGSARFSIDSPTREQIKEFLKAQNESVTRLVQGVKACKEYVRRMNEDMEEFKSNAKASLGQDTNSSLNRTKNY